MTTNSPEKLLIVNADDFGFTRDVNAGIVEAHEHGIVTATTLMANGEAFEDAVRLAREHRRLDIGCHLVLIQGRSAASPGTDLPATMAELMRALAARRLRPYDELRAQVIRILDAGIQPSHLDTHKHTHLLPPVLDAVARLSAEFGIRWVRRPFDLPLTAGAAPWRTRLVSRAAGLARRRFDSVLSSRGCSTTDHFAGFQLTGRLRAREMATLIGALPPGLTEFMCHPGRCTAELRCARTRLKESREAELEALIAETTREALRESAVRLISYRELG